MDEPQYTFSITSRSFLLRMRHVSNKFVEKVKIKFHFNIFLIVSLMRLYRKILQSRAYHSSQYGACGLHAGYLRLQTHTENCITYFFSTKQWLHEPLLTLRRLMSYIYIYIYIYMEHPFLMFLDHTQRRSTVGRTPLDE